MAEQEPDGSVEGGPHLKWATAPLPSNQLTLGQLRAKGFSHPEDLEIIIHNVSQLEMEVGDYSIVLATTERGTQNWRVREALRAENAKELASLYVQVGLASGPREAKQLVDNYISQVTREAGRSRGRD